MAWGALCDIHGEAILGSMLPQHIALCVSCFVSSKNFMSLLVGLRCECICPLYVLRWKTTFCGRRPSVDPCILPTPLCDIFSIGLGYLMFFSEKKNISKIISLRPLWISEWTPEWTRKAILRTLGEKGSLWGPSKVQIAEFSQTEF